VAAFSELRFAPPRIADLPVSRQMARSVLGQEISLPVIASPTGVHAVNPDVRSGVARGTAEAGTPMGLSSFASMPVEDVATVNASLFFQIYWSGGKDAIISRAERAARRHRIRLLALGRSSINDLSPANVITPDGFTCSSDK
jgi:L-lactate dehydrogenase (cytochrome)